MKGSIAPFGDGDRDMRGRFVQGNAGGPGNPHARQVARLRSALIGAVSEDDVRNLARALFEKAQKGDANAAKVLLGYLFGQPAPAVDPDRLDEQEAEIRRGAAFRRLVGD